MKKYELTDETKEVCGKILHRIRALIDFGDVSAGDLGGWVEKEENLSHEGNCWVYNEAQVYDNALVFGNARVHDNAEVFGNARICNNACIYDNTRAYDNARVYGNANVFNNARILDYAQVHDNARISDDVWISDSACIYDNAEVYGNARVHGSAYVFGNARVFNSACVCDDACVCDNARVYGNACVFDNARICENMHVSYSYAKTDLRKDIAASLRCQCNLLLINNKVIAYKIVNENLSSLHDKNFIYEVGKIAEVKDAEESNASCASGLHFSNLTYWDFKLKEYANKVYLVAEINVEDIITIQRGKIRCRKAKILDKVDIE